VFIITQDEIAKILKKAGWTETGRGKGSHRVFVSPDGKKVTTIPKPRRKDIEKGTLGEIKRQTGIDEIK
jgi:predicted RNA binding protein YcfA (HicA-like mRNA interferase family)